MTINRYNELIVCFMVKGKNGRKKLDTKKKLLLRINHFTKTFLYIAL